MGHFISAAEHFGISISEILYLMWTLLDEIVTDIRTFINDMHIIYFMCIITEPFYISYITYTALTVSAKKLSPKKSCAKCILPKKILEF